MRRPCQKTCETERTAHAQRINAVERAIEAMTDVAKTVADHIPRIKALEDRVLRGNTVWWVIVKTAAVVGGLAGFAATVLSLRHG